MTLDIASIDVEKLLEATYETFYMTLISLAATFVLGIILGLLLFITDKDGLRENKVINFVTATFVNVFRAIPFIILVLTQKGLKLSPFTP